MTTEVTPPLQFPDLSLANRPQLFQRINQHALALTGPAARCTFGDREGWIVSDMRFARTLLASSAGQKSRSRHSQQLLGGVGALEPDGVRDVKRHLIKAMGIEAKLHDLLAEHLRATMPADLTCPGRLTEAQASSMLAQLAGRPPGHVDGTLLRELVLRSWAKLESAPGKASPSPRDLLDDLAAYTFGLITGSRSGFLGYLRHQGWTDRHITEELRAMVLAGWGSTTAATLSAISLGVTPSSDATALDEVLRLYPPSFMIARIITKPDPALPFEAGDLVLVSPWLIHRSPHGWSCPHDYDTAQWKEITGERWFLPFGLGARRCPARIFARRQVAATLRAHVGASTPSPSGTAFELVESRSPALVPKYAALQ